MPLILGIVGMKLAIMSGAHARRIHKTAPVDERPVIAEFIAKALLAGPAGGMNTSIE
jgi:hypothetical protein